jgi:ribonuclease D
LGSASKNQLLVSDPNRHNEQSATKRRWYQLIHQQQQQPDKDEHSPKDNVVGLYPTQEEAQEALQILQELAQKRQENIELTIVPVER